MSTFELSKIGNPTPLTTVNIDVDEKMDEAQILRIERERKEEAEEGICLFYLIYAYRYIESLAAGTLGESMWVNISNLPSAWVKRAALIGMAVYWGVFIYFAKNSIEQQMSTTTVSLDYNKDLCVPSLAVLDFRTLVSVGDDGSRGLWQSNEGFTINTTAILFEFSGFQTTQANFSILMDLIGLRLSRVGARGQNRSLTWNLIAWSTYLHSPPPVYHVGKVTFALLGSPLTIFRAENYYGVVSSADGVCAGFQPVSYSKADSAITLDMSDIVANKTKSAAKCLAMMNQGIDFGYTSYNSGTKWNLRFEVRSALVAIAVNMKIININELQLTSVDQTDRYFRFPYEYCNLSPTHCQGLNVTSFSTYTQPYTLLGMNRVFCIRWSDGNVWLDFNNMPTAYATSCFYRSGNMLLLPTFSHYDSKCLKCDDPNFDPVYCNRPNFLLNFVFFPEETFFNFPKTIELAAKFAKLVRLNIDNDAYLNTLVHDAAFESMSGYDPLYYQDPVKIKAEFDNICKDMGCMLIVFNADSDIHPQINDYMLKFPRMACNNTIYQKSRFDELVKIQPDSFQLENEYYSCKQGVFEIAVFVIGICTSLAQVAVQCCLFFVFLIIGQYLFHTKGYRTGYADPDANFNMSKRMRKRMRMQKNAEQTDDDEDQPGGIIGQEAYDFQLQLNAVKKKNEIQRLKLQSEIDRLTRLCEEICSRTLDSTGKFLADVDVISQLKNDTGSRKYATTDEKLEMKSFFESLLGTKKY